MNDEVKIIFICMLTYFINKALQFRNIQEKKQTTFLTFIQKYINIQRVRFIFNVHA
jgi:hypothetical protein